MAIILRYVGETPDPERGYALAIMAGTLEFPTFSRKLIKELMYEHVDPTLFEFSYDYVGDISETIALLWPESNTPSDLPLLSELIITFNQLPKTALKAYLADLLNRCNTTQRWALLKLGTGSLRIGISARFLKNTLARYGSVEAQDIERIWHGLKPPYETLFAWLENRSEAPIVKDQIYFHPVMLSHPLDEKDIDLLNIEEFAFERKYDGIRVQVVSTGEGKALYSRKGDEISHSFPDLLECIYGHVVLDGELVIKTSQGVGSFNDLQQRLNRKAISKRLLQESPAAIILYDILFIGEQDLRILPFIERRAHLEAWFKNHAEEHILLSELLMVNSAQNIRDLKQRILSENHPAVEGLMLKHIASQYVAGRPKGQWYKWKRDPLVIDAILMYAQRGHGKRSSYYSDYTFGLWKEDQLLPIGKAYFGFTDEELLQLDRWIRNHTKQRFGPVREVAKELVFEVAFDAVNMSSRHKSGVALRFPRINRIRWDKPAAEADRLENLIRLIK